MNHVPRNSIRFKLIAIAAATSALSLLVASAGFPYFDLANFRDRISTDLAQQAAIVSSGSSAALEFTDKHAVTEALYTLNSQKDVRSAAVYSADGEMQASLVHDTAASPPSMLKLRGDSTVYSGDTVTLSHVIRSDKDVVGYVYIQSDLTSWYARRNKYLAIVVSLLAACLGIALLIGGRLQRIISKPIQTLLDTMQTVTREQRYDLRAAKRADDEIGQLVEAFNSMLAEIEVRDRTVNTLNDMLEGRVKSRTIQLEQEIADRSAAQEELLKSQIVLNDFFENATIGLNLVGPDGIVLKANRAELELLGYAADEYVGHSIAEFHTDPQPMVDLLEALAKGAPIASLESHIRCKDGSIKEVVIEANAMWEGDQFVHARCFTRDQTAQREAERAREYVAKAERANQAKSEFLSRMSHELRTPMNSILGFSQLLEMEELTEDQQDSVRQIISAGKHLLRLINEVLDISRIESGNLSVSNEPVNVIDAIQETVGIVQSLANARKIKIEYPKSAEPVFAIADEQRIRQVLLNLLSNAIKYNCEAGHVNVMVTHTDQHLRIEVKDTGPGISAEKASLLFMPFQRLGAEASGIEGTGLGLALSLRLAEAMDGRIGMEPSEGGAHFYLELGRAQCPHSGLPEANSDRADLFAAHSDEDLKISVLLVEDNPANIRLVEKVLADRPEIRLRVVARGWQGVQAARTETPDLVLLDLNLPDMNGFDVLQALKSEASTQSVPIIITSADATDGQIERLLRAGANEYLTKPLDILALRQSMDRCLEIARKRVA